MCHSSFCIIKEFGKGVLNVNLTLQLLFLVRSRTLLQTDDHSEYDDNQYHDNEANFSKFNNENESKLYTEEKKRYIEKLLANEDGNLLNSKLDAYINGYTKNGDVGGSTEVDYNNVKVVEIREDVVSSNRDRSLY